MRKEKNIEITIVAKGKNEKAVEMYDSESGDYVRYSSASQFGFDEMLDKVKDEIAGWFSILCEEE